MHPHTALSLALINEFDHERTRTVRRPLPALLSPAGRDVKA